MFFSPPVQLRRGSNRAAQWAPGVQPRGKNQAVFSASCVASLYIGNSLQLGVLVPVVVTSCTYMINLSCCFLMSFPLP